jgi:hypothetical protein
MRITSSPRLPSFFAGGDTVSLDVYALMLKHQLGSFKVNVVL